MRKLILFCLSAVMLLATSCESEVLDQEIKKPVINGGQASVTIMCDSMVITQSTRGRVELTGGYATGAGLYDGKAYVKVEAVPYPGYQLANFTGGKVGGNLSQYSGSSQYSFDVDQSDWRFSVTFKKEENAEYKISVNADAGGTVSGGGTVSAGESCTVNASANSGYSFVGWYEGSTKVSSSASYTFTVSSNRTFHVIMT